MILLQRFYPAFTTITVLNTLDTLNSSECTGDCSDVRNLVLQTHLADSLTILSVVSLCFWRVDYHTNFLVHNQIHNIRATGTDFIYNITLNSVCVVEVSCALSCNQSEAQVFQSFTNCKNFFFLAFFVAQRNKNLLVLPGSRCVWVANLRFAYRVLSAPKLAKYFVQVYAQRKLGKYALAYDLLLLRDMELPCL